ncbi:MAG TPA: hypothetical protein VFO19_13895 [Vicinamibacterales bacterium]|nr:hypothetical protein [Vicinamibacterales bacterium]
MTVLKRAGAAVVIALAAWSTLAAQETVADYQGPKPEEYLAKAKIKAIRDLGQGVTLPKKVTLERDGVEHFAVFKSIDETKAGVTRMGDGSMEVDFQDSWQLEIAAYEIDKMIGLGMVPATVERRLNNNVGSLQWWVESEMQEAERVEKRIQPPDIEAWNQVTYKVRLFDQLIANVDRHLKNLLVTKNFDLRLIDHSRSFRGNRELKDSDSLKRFSRSLLAGIKKLNQPDLKKRVGRYLTSGQIERLLQRRDAILALAAKRVAEIGEAAALYD